MRNKVPDFSVHSSVRSLAHGYGYGDLNNGAESLLIYKLRKRVPKEFNFKSGRSLRNKRTKIIQLSILQESEGGEEESDWIIILAIGRLCVLVVVAKNNKQLHCIILLKRHNLHGK